MEPKENVLFAVLKIRSFESLGDAMNWIIHQKARHPHS